MSDDIQSKVQVVARHIGDAIIILEREGQGERAGEFFELVSARLDELIAETRLVFGELLEWHCAVVGLEKPA